MLWTIRTANKKYEPSNGTKYEIQLCFHMVECK